MKHKTISNPLKAIKQTAGRFASVTYTNKQGNTKTYTIRTGVRKYTKGVGRAKVPNSVTVFCVDLANRGYKTFIQSGIKKVRCGKLTFTK
jgi:hypothetical protein